jgi:dihydrofolate synthase/folylpolyglutamate synthase
MSKGYVISETHIRKGIREVIANTGLKGRWQIIKNKPQVICDTGHNEAGIRFIVEQLYMLKFDRLYWVLGMVKDKDPEKILQLLPKNAYYFFCQAAIPRALDAQILSELALTAGLKGEVIVDVNTAYETALNKANPEDLIMIGGSTFVVAEIKDL